MIEGFALVCFLGTASPMVLDGYEDAERCELAADMMEHVSCLSGQCKPRCVCIPGPAIDCAWDGK